MFLKNLKIENGDTPIRNISFHKGLNLIVDETKTDSQQESGNNVGKTTILRLIDFCLAGDGTNIYQDKEFKEKSNTQIEDFLKNNNIIITLTLSFDLEDKNSEEVEIRRNFLTYGQKIQEINGQTYTNEAFPKELERLLFKTQVDKPSFRQMIAKNIRYEKNTLHNTVKVLNAFTTQEEYETLFLFWLGIELDNSARQQRLTRDKRIEEGLQKRLRKDNSPSQIDQSLIVINRTITELEAKKERLNLNDNYSADINRLSNLTIELNKTSTSLSRLELRKELILEGKKDLESEASNIDTSRLKTLYIEASKYIDSMQKSFDETLKFHNGMIQERLIYITEELPNLEVEVENLRKKLATLSEQESALTQELKKKGALENLYEIMGELNKAYEKKGDFDGIKRMWEDSNSNLSKIESELQSINDGIRSKDSSIQEKIADFNKHFADISEQLYREKFILSSSDTTDNHYTLNISSISGNLGTGKKKGQIAAFDLAYIKFAEEQDIECLHFILHDQLENIHNNQLNLLLGIVEGINCQFVIPILSDKLPSDLEIAKYKVLTLSQADRLFKIP